MRSILLYLLVLGFSFFISSLVFSILSISLKFWKNQLYWLFIAFLGGILQYLTGLFLIIKFANLFNLPVNSWIYIVIILMYLQNCWHRLNTRGFTVIEKTIVKGIVTGIIIGIIIIGFN